ncbi:hypothetical protein ACKI2N_033115 [Cupriavidus sp. 30B13]|uniref:hypothetical protein n=1 Tax=Cupriavidus sp. 30B13 TaxID=3384241 RepID=UPI003B8EF2F4
MTSSLPPQARVRLPRLDVARFLHDQPQWAALHELCGAYLHGGLGGLAGKLVLLAWDAPRPRVRAPAPGAD